MRGVVLGLDSQRQGFDRAHVEVGHLFHMAFFVFQLGEVQAIGAVNQVHGGQDQQRSLPLDNPVQPTHQPGNAGAHQVVGERPEIAVRPDAPQRFVLGERDDGRYRKRVGGEIIAAVATSSTAGLFCALEHRHVINAIGQRDGETTVAQVLKTTCTALGRSR